MDAGELVSTAALNHMKSQVPDAAERLHELLGCEFGHGRLAHRDDQIPCAEAAVQIVVLHEGSAEAAFKLCARHRELVCAESTER